MASVAAYVARPLPPAAAVATVPVTGIISGPSSSCGAAAATVAASTSSVTPSAPPPSMPSPLVATGSGGGKDSRWLTLEVCREHVRRRCTRSDDECRFAHPPPHVEVQNGRVVCCFDSIKGRCQRTDPPCKYLHPPQHLKEQLLQNGRNNLIMRNLNQLQRIQTLPPTAALYSFIPPYVMSSPAGSQCYAPYYCSASQQCVVASQPNTCAPPPPPPSSAAMMANFTPASPTTMSVPNNGQSTDMQTDECNGCGAMETMTTPSSGTDQYWTVAPPPIYAVDAASSPAAAASYFSPMFFQPNVAGGPPAAAAGVMLKPHQTVVGNAKNGFAVYSCASPIYQQMTMPVNPPQCYPLTIAAGPPVVGAGYQQY